MSINANELNNAVNGILDQYKKSVCTATKKHIADFSKELVRETKRGAPVGSRSKHFRDNVSSKNLDETDTRLIRVWYVKGKDYRLTHLLEKGHKTKNGKSVKGFKFIQASLDKLTPTYIKKIERAIEDES